MKRDKEYQIKLLKEMEEQECLLFVQYELNLDRYASKKAKR